MSLEDKIAQRLKQKQDERQAAEQAKAEQDQAKREAFDQQCQQLADIATAIGVKADTITKGTPETSGVPCVIFSVADVPCGLELHQSSDFKDLWEGNADVVRLLVKNTVQIDMPFHHDERDKQIEASLIDAISGLVESGDTTVNLPEPKQSRSTKQPRTEA